MHFYSARWSFYFFLYWITKLSKCPGTSEKYCMKWLWEKNIWSPPLKLFAALNRKKATNLRFCLLLSPFYLELRWRKSNKPYFDSKLYFPLFRKKKDEPRPRTVSAITLHCRPCIHFGFLACDFVPIYSAHSRNKIKL